MDFLNQAYGQAIELFRSMTPAARITTALLLAVLLVSLTFLFQHQPESADHFLFGQHLTHEEVAALQSAFGQAGLNSWKIVGNRILVPRSERDRYYAAASEYGAQPDSADAIWNNVVEKYSPLEPGSLLDMRKKRLQHSDLEYILRQNREIEQASVRIEEKQNGTLRRNPEKTAVAIVQTVGNHPLDATLIDTVRNIVADGGGVDRKNVTVVDAHSGNSSRGQGPDGAPLPEQNPYLITQQHFEQLYRGKIEQQLSNIQGVKVEVFVELDKNLKNQSSTRNYEEGVQVNTVEYKKESNSARPANQGPPGVRTNTTQGGNNPATISATAQNENTLSEERNEYQRLPAETTKFTVSAPLVPTHVKASISVPDSHYVRVWRQQNPTPLGEQPGQPDPTALTDIEQQEIKRIQEAVDALIPDPPPGETTYPRIKVTSYTETPLPDLEGPSVVSTVGDWFGDNWQTLGMFALAAVGVFMLRGMIQSAQALSAAQAERRTLPAERLAALDADEEGDALDEDDEFVNSLKARFQGSERSLREELTEVVREDVDAAASVLRNWIGEPV